VSVTLDCTRAPFVETLVLTVATLVGRNANEGMVVPMVGFGWSLESGGRFCVALVSVAVKDVLTFNLPSRECIFSTICRECCSKLCYCSIQKGSLPLSLAGSKCIHLMFLLSLRLLRLRTN
jgi:hypothetical protein